MTDRPMIRNPECFHPWPGCICPKWIPAPAEPEPLVEVQPARREYSIQPPIRPGTARRLGLRQPSGRRLMPSERTHHEDTCAYPSGVGFCSCAG